MKNKLLSVVLSGVLCITSLFPVYAEQNAPGDSYADASFFDESDISTAFSTGFQLGTYNYKVGDFYEFRLTTYTNDYTGEDAVRTLLVTGPKVEMLQNDQYSELDYKPEHVWQDISNYNGLVNLKTDKRWFRVKFAQEGRYEAVFMIHDENGQLLGGTKRYIDVKNGKLEIKLPPIVPKNMKLVKTTDNYQFSWDAISSASKYNIYINGEIINEVSSNSCDLNSTYFEGEDEYLVGVSAVGNEGLESAIKTILVKGAEKKKFTVKIDGVDYTTVEEGSDINLPKESVVGYYANGKLYQKGSKYVVDSDVDFASVKLGVYKSVSLRYSEPTSLTFVSKIQSSNTDAITNCILEEGTIFTTSAYYNNMPEFERGGKKVFEIVNKGWYNNEIGKYSASLSGITENNYSKEYAARAYVKVKYSDGTVATAYSKVVDRKSVQEIAYSIMRNSYNNLTDSQKMYIDRFLAAD